MADEYSLEELTAFLEEDSTDEDVPQTLEENKLESTNKQLESVPTKSLVSSPHETEPCLFDTDKSERIVNSDGVVFEHPEKTKSTEERNQVPDHCSKNNLSKIFEMEEFHDSDSDMDDAAKETLTNEGKEIKKLMESETKRNSLDIHDIAQAERPSWKSKNSISQTNVKKNASQSEEKFITDCYTGLRIVKPLISSSELARKVHDRRVIKMSKLHLKIKTTEVQSNWVTIGVVVHKLDSKMSANGKVYTIWKLSDLDDCTRVVSFFLFGQVYKEHWKTSLGTVVGLSNPTIMDSADKSNSDVAITINSPHQLLIIGHSKDLGWCRGKTKMGNACSNFISKKFGDYCPYHVQKAYSKAAAKRSELQGSFTGAAPKSYEQKLMKTGGHFIYGGQTFLSSSTKPKKKAKDQLTVGKLQAKQLDGKEGKTITTLLLNDIAPCKTDAPQEKSAKEGDNPFVELISTPSVGSMNLVKHLIKQEMNDKMQKEKIVIRSVTPKEILQMYKKTLKEKQQENNSVDNNPSLVKPVLGKGFGPGSDIFLDSRPLRKTLKSTNQSTEQAKRKAIQKVAAKGGIAKENPNAVRKPAGDNSKKRVRKSLENEQKTQTQREEPPAKRSKLLGNVDLKMEEIKKLMKSGSSHKGALAEIEAEKEEKLFNELEKKEKMAEQMQSITELKVTVITCKQCQYTAFSAADNCKKEHHNIVRHKAIKRFFVCKDCKTRTVAITKYPLHACKKCNSDRFEKTSMYKEKAGPILESEILCLRGDEIKFLNSLQENVF